MSDINTLATSAIVADLAILATSDIVSDINVLATSDIVSDLNTLATSDFVSDLNIVGTTTNVANIATVATNVAGVNSFAARYRVAGSDPGSDNDAGDLVFNTSSNILKVYNGSSFEDITGSTLAGLSDTNITSPADGSILLYDTGTSKYIDNVISGDATLADTGVLTLSVNSVDSDQYVDGSIDTIHLSADAVDGTKIADNAINSEHYTDGSIDTAHIADAQVTAAKLAADAVTTQFRQNAKPILINGAMAIDQRNSGASITANDSTFVVDRWKFRCSQASKLTAEQVTDVPSGQGFYYSTKITSSSALSVGASDFFNFAQLLEGQDITQLMFGSANAKTITVSFWVKSSLTGNFALGFNNFQGSARAYPAEYVINSANTWEKKTVVVPGDTSGTWVSTNATGLGIIWNLGYGSNAHGTKNAWNAGDTSSFSGAVNLVATSGATLFITGVQLEVGNFDANSIAPFQHESFGNSFHRCQRYCQKYLQPPLVGVANATQTVARASMSLQARMRTNPTASQVGGNFVWFNTNGHQPQSSGFSATYTDEDTFEADVTMTATGNTVPSICKVYQSGNAYLLLSAEL